MESFGGMYRGIYKNKKGSYILGMTKAFILFPLKNLLSKQILKSSLLIFLSIPFLYCPVKEVPMQKPVEEISDLEFKIQPE